MLDQIRRFSLFQKLVVFVGLPCAALFACVSVGMALSVIASEPSSVQQAAMPQQVTPVTQAPAAPVPPTDTPIPATLPQDLQEAQVVGVVDGDTIDVLINGAQYRIRYILVDTPEVYGGTQPFGPEASQANKELVQGKTVLLEKDVSETDRYGRLLRYVYVGDLMINEELLRLGLARVATFPPDVKYVDRFLEIQRQAQAAEVGLWATEPVVELPTATPAPAVPPPATPVPTAPPPSSGSSGYIGPYDPSGPDRDCSDFSSWNEAQAFFEAAGGPSSDPHSLDGDRDGVVCERMR